jgi:hypothetical protein
LKSQIEEVELFGFLDCGSVISECLFWICGCCAAGDAQFLSRYSNCKTVSYASCMQRQFPTAYRSFVSSPFSLFCLPSLSSILRDLFFHWETLFL